MRKNINDNYDPCEVGADGSGLRQLMRLTNVADIDPVYPADSGIVFSSTCKPRYCGCNQHIVANLYRVESDGVSIHQIGGSTLVEGRSHPLPDGRVIFAVGVP